MKKNNDKTAIQVIDVTKTFKIYYDKASTLKEKLMFWKRNESEVFTALKDINITIKRKEGEFEVLQKSYQNVLFDIYYNTNTIRSFNSRIFYWLY